MVAVVSAALGAAGGLVLGGRARRAGASQAAPLFVIRPGEPTLTEIRSSITALVELAIKAALRQGYDGDLMVEMIMRAFYYTPRGIFKAAMDKVNV